MLYNEDIEIRLSLCAEEMHQSFPFSVLDQSPHPTNGTKNLIHMSLKQLLLEQLSQKHIVGPMFYLLIQQLLLE